MFFGLVQPSSSLELMHRAQLTATVKLTRTDEKTIRTILASCPCSPSKFKNLAYADPYIQISCITAT